MPLDFNNSDDQVSFRELMPEGTIVPVVMTLRPGGAGDGGWEKRSNDGSSTMLDVEFIVTEGPYAKRRFWNMFMVTGSSDGQAKAVEITGTRIKAILEAARGIRPGDSSDAAKAARRINSYGDLDGLRFLCRVGIDKGGKNEQTGETYRDKNVFDIAITPDRKEYRKVEQVPKVADMASHGQTSQGQQSGGAKPAWAT